MSVLPSAMFEAESTLLFATVYCRLALELQENSLPPTLHIAVGLPGLQTRAVGLGLTLVPGIRTT